jgi:hypothetical protein
MATTFQVEVGRKREHAPNLLVFVLGAVYGGILGALAAALVWAI